MGKKNIDELFQEKLQNFNQLPDNKVWERLEASLDEKKKDRKIIPIWWKLGGIAAVLTIFIFTINPFGKNTNVPAITNIETTVPNKEKNAKNNSENIVEKEIELVNVPDVVNKKDKEEQSIKKKSNILSKRKENISNKIVSHHQEHQKKLKEKENSGLLMASTYKDKTITIKEEDSIRNNNKSANKEKLNTMKKLSLSNDVAITKSKKDAIVKEDSIKKKSIYEEIKNMEEEEVIASNKKNKWSVGASVAPVYFNSLDDGSPVHKNFVSNSKSGNVNMSYGVFVSYDLGKKLSIRSGLHKVNYGYNTNNVVFKSAFDPSTDSMINSIDYDTNAENVVLDTNKTSTPIHSENSDFSAKSTYREGRMVQQLGYLEVPLEINYAIIESKFGISLIGGISSLFLLDNSISLESENLKTEVGKSNNINGLNFSTNIGLGLNYKFTPSVQLNIEPVFKYQLNTFNNTSGNFQPFSMGVYSGLSFRF